MDDNNALFFHAPHSGRICFKEMTAAIADFIRQDERMAYKVVVGSDTSAGRLEPLTTSIITVVAVWRIGHGATYFWAHSEPRTFHHRRDRIIAETMASLTLAQEIRSHLKDEIGDEFLWNGNEIHVDIGNGGETRSFIQEVTGLVKGFNFEPIIKPDAWCASSVADRHC